MDTIYIVFRVIGDGDSRGQLHYTNTFISKELTIKYLEKICETCHWPDMYLWEETKLDLENCKLIGKECIVPSEWSSRKIHPDITLEKPYAFVNDLTEVDLDICSFGEFCGFIVLSTQPQTSLE